MEKTTMRRALVRTTLALALLSLSACAPERDDGDGDPIPWGNTLQSAFFTQVDYGGFFEFVDAHVALIDEEGWSCEDLGWEGTVPWWQLTNQETLWVEARLVIDEQSDSWERAFESFYSWNLESSDFGADTAWFQGEVGRGGQNDVPVEPGRESIGYMAGDVEHADDTLEIQYIDSDEVRGQISSVEGDYSFVAINCGTVFEQIDGDVPPPEPDPGDEG